MKKLTKRKWGQPLLSIKESGRQGFREVSELFLGLSRRSSVEFPSGRKIHRCGRDRSGARARAGGAQVNPAQRALQAGECAKP